MELINIKKGDKDSLGDEINKIFYRKTIDDKNVDYLIYEISENDLRFDARDVLAKKLINYSSLIVDIQSSLNVNPELKKRYNPFLANLIRNVFDSEEKADFKPLFEKLQSNIVGNILSIARLKYLKLCLVFLLIVLSQILVLWWYNSTISGTYFFKDFSKDFINMFYLASAGAVGGFISVTLKISTIPIDPFIPFRRTRLDAIIRIVLAMIFGILIFGFLKSEFVSFLDSTKLNFDYPKGILLSLSIAVVSGFSERLIPNILSREEDKYLRKVNQIKTDSKNKEQKK